MDEWSNEKLAQFIQLGKENSYSLISEIYNLEKDDIIKEALTALPNSPNQDSYNNGLRQGRLRGMNVLADYLEEAINILNKRNEKRKESNQ